MLYFFQNVSDLPMVSNADLVKSRETSSIPASWIRSAASTDFDGRVSPKFNLTLKSGEDPTHLDPNEMAIEEIYAEWSRWSRCSRKCKQKRERRCAVPHICGSAVIKMERGCHTDRCRGRDFHIVRKKKLRRKTKNDLKRNRGFYTK